VVTDVAYFTVALDDPGGRWADPQQALGRARQSAAEMQREGQAVRFLRAVYVPEDDRWFLIYEAPTPQAVRDALERARLSSTTCVTTLTTTDRGGPT
jgi:Protein of unknown function (DUF4242)